MRLLSLLITVTPVLAQDPPLPQPAGLDAAPVGPGEEDKTDDPLGSLFEGQDEVDLTALSLEDLMSIDIEVTSVSRKKESLAKTAAAVYVISAEDIRRSGALSIPEALRMAPGIQVSLLGPGEYAVSARGFNDQFADKILVLIDGRSVYTPLFSGTFWQDQGVLMEDIERIEVVRGPGGTMWGANAVNGVINIITKPAAETQDNQLSLLAGTRDMLRSTLRAGGKLGEDAYLRAYVETWDRGTLDPPATGIESNFEDLRAGFRLDWDGEQNETWTIQGDAHRTDSSYSVEAFLPDAPYQVDLVNDRRGQGANLLARWSRERDDGGSESLQTYFAREEFSTVVVSEERSTFDIDYQRRRSVGEHHDMIWGLGFRTTRSTSEGTASLSFEPDSRTDNLFSGFIQDEYQVSDDLELIFGAKLEHNDYTAFEFQPNARFSLSTGEHSTLWGAVSRAVRTPSQISADLRFLQGVLVGTPPGFNTLIELVGNEDFKSEEMIAYELGFRTRIGDATTVDVATFVHSYENLATTEFGTATVIGPGVIQQPVFTGNLMNGIGYGAEIVAQHVINERWQVFAGYSLLILDLDADPSTTDPDPESDEDVAPKNQAHLRSFYNLGEHHELDLAAYYVDQLDLGIPAYVRTDVRLGWNPRENLRLSVGVQGLFHNNEQEFAPGAFGEFYGAKAIAYIKLDLGF
jgi:iron complex outermembrane recepter protein